MISRSISWRYSRTVVGDSDPSTWSIHESSSCLSVLAVEVILPSDTFATSAASVRKRLEEMPIQLVFLRAQKGNRTPDLRITSALLYRLSYLGAQLRSA